MGKSTRQVQQMLAGDAVATEPTSAPKVRVAAGSSIAVPSSHSAGSAEQTSAAKLEGAGGAGSTARTAAAKSGKSSGRSIPAAVRREVWRRDSGCCSYVDRHTGRRCGSRFFLEIDHIVPVARGGGAEAGNLRLRCAAHHRYRHGRRQRRRSAQRATHLLGAEPRAPGVAALVAVHAVAFVCGLFAWQCAAAIASRVNDFLLPRSAFAAPEHPERPRLDTGPAPL